MPIDCIVFPLTFKYEQRVFSFKGTRHLNKLTFLLVCLLFGEFFMPFFYIWSHLHVVVYAFALLFSVSLVYQRKC